MSQNSLSNDSHFIFTNLMLLESSQDDVLHENSSTKLFEPSEHSALHTPSLTKRGISKATFPVEASLAKLSRQVEALTELQALRQAASLGEQQKRRGRSIRQEVTLSKTDARETSYAEPLSPLKARDINALAELFQREDIYMIEVDISQTLLRLLPEPCWEEDPFQVLKEFL